MPSWIRSSSGRSWPWYLRALEITSRRFELTSALLGLEVAALDPLGQLDLLGAGQQRMTADLLEEQRHRVGGASRQVVVGVARLLDVLRDRSRRAGRVPRSCSMSCTIWASSSPRSASWISSLSSDSSTHESPRASPRATSWSTSSWTASGTAKFSLFANHVYLLPDRDTIATPMSFASLYSHGFVRVAAAVPHVRIGEPGFNAERTLGARPAGLRGARGARDLPRARDIGVLDRRPAPPDGAARRGGRRRSERIAAESALACRP